MKRRGASAERGPGSEPGGPRRRVGSGCRGDGGGGRGRDGGEGGDQGLEEGEATPSFGVGAIDQLQVDVPEGVVAFELDEPALAGGVTCSTAAARR
jgi:hypothetical protein